VWLIARNRANVEPTYFVTGGSGFVGRALCEQLCASGASVVALVRRADHELDGLGVEVHVGELHDVERVGALMVGADIVVHCAGEARFGNGLQYQAANVELTRSLVEAAKAKRNNLLKRFVFISTIGAIDRSAGDNCHDPIREDSAPSPTSDYGRSKLAAEKVVMDSGLPFTIIRPTMVVGRGMRSESHFAFFAGQALMNTLFSRFAWPGRFSVIHVDDLVLGIQTAATHPDAACKVYNCAGGSISLAEFFYLCRPGAFRIGLQWAQQIFMMFAFMVPFKLKALLLPALQASDRPLRELGWKPAMEPSEALQEVIDRERARLDPYASPAGQTIITGAASGLGKSLVEILAPKRARLLLVDRDQAGLDALKQTYPHCTILVADLASHEQTLSIISGPEWSRFPVSELFACAGIGYKGSIQSLPNDTHQRTFAVNVLARITLGQAAIAQMARTHFGRVVMISSSSAFQPLPYMATYAASNSALLSLSEAWALEVAGQGVHIMIVCPGGMQTNFQKSAGVREIEGEGLMTPDEAAVLIINGLRKRRMTLMVSFRSLAMAFLARLLPRKMSAVLWGRLMEKMR
jgi:short-subunit dehydrogenase